MNGWKNYETWACNLWLTNEEPVYRYWTAAAKETLKAENGDKTRAAYTLAERIKDELEDGAPEIGASLYADIMTAALQRIDYIEVATAFLDE